MLSVKKLYPACRIRVIAFHYPFEKKDYEWHGVDVHAIGGRNRKKFFALQAWYRAYQKIKEIHQKEPLLGILSFWITDCALVGNYFSKKHAVRHLTWIIGQDARTGNKHVGRIRPKADQLIAMSDFLQEEFESNYHIRAAHVIPNGINEEIFPAFNTGERPIDVFGAGSLIPLKNYQLFVELVASLKKTMPLLRACIAGDGEEKEMLMALIKAQGLGQNIVLLGQQTHREVLELMGRSKVFLHTSHYEGNSTVLAEALYSGCTAVSTQALSKQGLKNLFVSGDKRALTAHLAEVLSKPLIAERIVFNTMDQSAKKIMELFLH